MRALQLATACPCPRRLRLTQLSLVAVVLFALGLVPSAARAADLHATPSNFSSVYSSAAGGDTIYLATGSYGTFSGSAKSLTVTIAPESGATPTMSINFNGATNLKVTGAKITSATVQGTSRNITIANSTFTGDTVIRPDQMTNANIVFDGNTHNNITPSGSYEGRISLTAGGNPSGVVIKNSLFSGGLSDGIQNGSKGTQILDNEFTNIHQGDPNIAHTDALQLYGASNTVIKGNYFHAVEDCIMAPDGTNHETITDNVCVTDGSQNGFTIGSDNGSTISHNTFGANGLRLYGGNANKASTGTIVQDNILPGGDTITGSSLTVDYNLSKSTTSGTHAISGSPTYVGGSKPTTLAGYALASNSLGKSNASDGGDRGADAADDGTVTPPPADTTAPDTTISSGPTGTITTTSASFAFTGSESGSTFECKLDSGSWATCTSPKNYTSVADGAHTFSVRATDTAGNTDASPATRSFTVNTTPTPPPADTTAPDTTISSGPTGTTNDATPSFTFTSSESGSTFQCRVDLGSWTSCTSPRTFAALADGAHTFAVRAIDAAGNIDTSAASRAFTVDTTAPSTTLNSAPMLVVIGPDATVAFSADDAAAHFECEVDGGAWVPCGSPYAISSLTLGSHTVSVRATDAAGNVESTPASATWTTIAAPTVDPPAPPVVVPPIVTDPPTTTTPTPPATIPTPTPTHNGRTTRYHTPKTVKVHNSMFSVGCGKACTVKATTKLNNKTVSLGSGTGEAVTLTAAGRKLLAAAGKKGISATVRTVAGETSYTSKSKLQLA
jgi:hypothetical protein